VRLPLRRRTSLFAPVLYLPITEDSRVKSVVSIPTGFASSMRANEIAKWGKVIRRGAKSLHGMKFELSYTSTHLVIQEIYLGLLRLCKCSSVLRLVDTLA